MDSQDRTSEAEWIRRAQHGDKEAFGQVVEKHMQQAYYAALGILGTHEDALDASQEAFVKAVREGSRPQVSAEDAIAAMELAERIVKVMGEHQWAGRDAATISSGLITEMDDPGTGCGSEGKGFWDEGYGL